MIDKTTMGNALRLFRRYQLIELLDSDLKNEESRVLIYNSILMAVRVEDIKSVYEKVDSYRKGKLKMKKLTRLKLIKLASFLGCHDRFWGLNSDFRRKWSRKNPHF